MPATAARPPSRRLAAVLATLICAALAPLAAGHAQAPAQTKPPATLTKPLLVLPTDNVGLPAQPKLTDDALDAAQADTFPLGLHLGMTPEAVNERLAHPVASVAPQALTKVAYLGPATVVSFAIAMSQAGDLRPAIVSCFGPNSRIVFLFHAGELYTISFRFTRGGGCLDPKAAADELYQRLLAIPFGVMPSSHYRVGDIDVVDAWDPTVTTVTRRPWRQEP